jgi:hypothetical protein
MLCEKTISKHCVKRHEKNQLRHEDFIVEILLEIWISRYEDFIQR